MMTWSIRQRVGDASFLYTDLDSQLFFSSFLLFVWKLKLLLVLNDEVSRKYIQSLKRLMTFAQTRWPPKDVSMLMGWDNRDTLYIISFSIGNLPFSMKSFDEGTLLTSTSQPLLNFSNVEVKIFWASFLPRSTNICRKNDSALWLHVCSLSRISFQG